MDDSETSREEELIKLEKTKTGVKGLVDSGITKVPDIFIYPKEHQQDASAETCKTRLQIPVIDLADWEEGDRRSRVVGEILEASRTWGMFELINHGLPKEVIQRLLDCVQEFNEQPVELKSEFYSRDEASMVQYRLSLHRVFQTALWKDTITCHFEKGFIEEGQVLPSVCRKPMSDYLDYTTRLQDVLSALLSEALGLNSNHLKMMQCMESQKLNCHYYPACPEPSLVMGTPKHSDPYFFTILVHNNINGLQVLYENQWVDVNPMEGSIIANIGDMLQLVSNDIFHSAEHRVLASPVGPRVSVACFFCPSCENKDRAYGPINELLVDGVTPLYKATSQADYVQCFIPKGNAGSKALTQFRL
ncbi:1-aminocyclopropane-1-carboxylate oxidase homolog 1-like [Silene latifolia]|uniref:1-aminocyclopropane-1-carboxylate oxidase homolog 1-like n=1 Tax=Silene latifolia TaxID=37657 RepID=UPI003D787D56